MAQATPCPTALTLKKLVDGSATPAEQAALALHLDGCGACQATLDQLSGGRESWNEFARDLERPPAREPALAHALKRLAADPGGTVTAGGARINREAELKFLDPPDKPGQLGKLAHYEILEEIGRGGMGIVLKANDTKLQRIVAIKVMAPELAAQASARQRFIREARAAAAVAHDHVVTIHGVEEDHSPPYLVMQYIQGRSLQQRIDDCGALEVKEILRIGLQAASGLAAAHAQGLVHRDIKPANILLENGVERVKITDFGLARAIDDARVTQSGVVTGTPQYMSPEQAGGKSVDHRADLFSLGGVMYAMCTGYAPFRASSSMAVLKKVCDESPRPIRDLNPEIPDWLAAIVEKLMAKDPKDRFAGATDLANLLGQHLAHMQQPAVFPRPAELNRPKRPAPANAAKGSLALPILLMLAPFLLVPALIAATRFLDFRPAWLTVLGTVVIGGGCLLVGAILLMVQLARRGNSAWIIVLLLLVLLVACPLPLVAVLGGISFLSLRGGAPPGPGLEAQMTEQGMSDPVTKPDALRDMGRAINDFKPGPWIAEPKDPPGGTLANGLNWFPEETTFCASFDFQTAPAELGDAVWGLSRWMLGKPSRFGEFASAVGDGTIMRLSFAHVEDPAGKKSRQFVRLSGLWKRDGVINALKKNAGVSQLDLPNSGAEKITILNFGKEFSLAVVGSHDILLCAYDRIPEGAKGHEDVVREALDCKSNRLRSLRSGPLEAQLPDVHNNAYCVIAGELPKSLHESWKNVFGVLPRAVRIVLSEPAPTGPGAMGPAPGLEPGANVNIGLSLAMKNRGDAESMIQNAGGWPRRMRDYLDSALSELEAKGKAGPGAKSKAAMAKAREQLRLGSLPRASSAINGFEAYVSLEMPASIWRAMIVLAKAGLPPAEPPGVGAPHKPIKRFDPKVDKPITKQSAACSVMEDDGGWKISKAKTNAGQEFGLHEGVPVRLFEIRRPEIEGRRVTLRALVKSEAVDPAHQACFALQADAGRQWPGSREHHFGPARKGKTNWTDYEISFDCPSGVKPELLRVDAFLIWEGSIWIKDIEIVTTPLGVPHAPFEPAQKNSARAEPSPSKEVVIKKFNSVADDPITMNVGNRKVTGEEDGWMIQSSDNTSYSGDNLIPRVHLFEFRCALTYQEQLTVRFKARSENVKFAFLELVGGDASPSPRIEGSTNWKTYEVTMGNVNNRKVDMFAIDAVIRNGSAAKATIWIKDLEVVKSSLKSAPVVPAKEIPLKKFDPKADKPFQTEVGDQRLTLDGDAWRIEAKTVPSVSSRYELRLFELTKQEVRHSTIVLRFKMKTEKVAENVAASVTLRVGEDVSNWLGRYGNPVRGTTAWKEYEVRCKCGDLSPADISIRAGISASNGTMWLKDLELVKIPEE